LQTSSETRFVKDLQMIQLQKAIIAVGMFSIFESILQSTLDCKNGFTKAKQILDFEGEIQLNARLNDLALAVNALKHGQGRSYDSLIGKKETLDFVVKTSRGTFFCEGDVSEVSTIIKVDDKFILDCADVIRDVTEVINRSGAYYL
jgi:hypothetical protein